MVKKYNQKGRGRTLNIPKTLPPGQVPDSSFNGAVTIGEACNGPWCSIPVTPNTTNFTNNNLLSATPPNGSITQYPGNNRPGNNTFDMPGIDSYQGTALNHGKFNILCPSTHVGGGKDKQVGEKISDKPGCNCISDGDGGCSMDPDGEICECFKGECECVEMYYNTPGNDFGHCIGCHTGSDIGHVCTESEGSPEANPYENELEGGGYSVYNTIVNPETGRKVNIYGKKGTQILQKYLKVFR